MPVPKILKLVQSCGECPHYRYYSGGVYQCALVGQAVREKESVAPFCPLSDFPSATIAGMESTIERLREPYRYSIGLAVLSHIATKLKVNLDPRGASLNIPLLDGGDLLLSFENITNIGVNTHEVHFFSSDGAEYKLLPDGDSPKLYKSKEVEGHGKLSTEVGLKL